MLRDEENYIGPLVTNAIGDWCRRKFETQATGKPEAVSEYGAPYITVACAVMHYVPEGTTAEVQRAVTGAALIAGITAGLERLAGDAKEPVLVWRIPPALTVYRDATLGSEHIVIKVRLRAHVISADLYNEHHNKAQNRDLTVD